MQPGTIVQVTAGRLGGWDDPDCSGRPTDRVVTEGWVGEIVNEADWIEPDVWFVARFELADGPIYVPVALDHVRVVGRYIETDVHGKTVFVCSACGFPVSKGSRKLHSANCEVTT